jgi:hypothetical protein|tara:strand:+ start:378 stop:527 length:150 start_codon:yes stop_codon:yes gene_type:complete
MRPEFIRPAEAPLVYEKFTRTVVGFAATALPINIRLFHRCVGRAGPDLM